MLSADELANRMTNDLMKDLGVKDGEEIALLVNGGTPLQELYLFNNAVTRELAAETLKSQSIRRQLYDEYRYGWYVFNSDEIR